VIIVVVLALCYWCFDCSLLLFANNLIAEIVIAVALLLHCCSCCSCNCSPLLFANDEIVIAAVAVACNLLLLIKLLTVVVCE